MDDVYEPRHLLKFTGDPELQLYYRSLVYNFHRKDASTKTNKHRCHVCNTVLSTQEGTRLKPAQRMTRTIQKLMVKKSRKIPLNRIELFKLKKFMDSSQQILMKCPECTVVNKMPVLGRRDVIKIKSKLISEVKESAKLKAEEERGGKMDVAEPGIVKDLGGEGEIKGNDVKEEGGTKSTTGEKKKKKKKKNKSKKTKDLIETLIQQKASERKKSRKKKKSASTPVSLRDFVLTETEGTPFSSSPIDILRNVFQSSDTSYQQTPVCTNDSAGKHKQSQSAATTTTIKTTTASKKSKKKLKNKKDLSKTLFFETPEYSNAKVKTKTNQTPVSARSGSSLNTSTNTPQQLPSTTSKSKKGKKKAIQKELRKYLTLTKTPPPSLQEKSSSLKDFLISL